MYANLFIKLTNNIAVVSTLNFFAMRNHGLHLRARETSNAIDMCGRSNDAIIPASFL